MFDPEIVRIAVIVLVALAVGMVGYILAWPYLSGERRMGERVQDASAGAKKAKERKPKDEALQTRKRQVQDTIKDMEAREKAKKKVSLRIRLLRAGLDITPQSFWIGSFISAVGVGALAFLLGGNIYVAPLAALAGGLGLPRWVLGFLARRRQNAFMREFANAIDVIVRGVKSGLPLNDCLGIIARESPEPIASEFQALVEQQRVGVPMQECFDRMMVRMPLQDLNFFAIVIAIQQTAGGNLSEALGNLSGVLRDRKKLDGKVKALSAEAKASAGILAALPFLVMMMVYFTTPDYIATLWRERVGHFLLAIAGFWMSCGVFVMRKMINFKY